MLQIYNSLHRKKEEFKPLKDKKVGMYVCGPTVYGPGHIGHARTYISFDVIRKYLEYSGYKVKFVMNITDVHDDVIRTAQEQNTTLFELADKNTKLFFQDLEKLGIKKHDVNPRVTETIEEIIEMVSVLQKKGFAYETEDGVYFNVSKFKSYGNLSGAKASEGKTGQRVKTDKYDKENVQDFALWKKQKPDEPSWDSPWGKGRPGWHIECSVMSTKYLGETFDIHAGAIDLIFPHHENEIAQSECAIGKKFVNYWMHAGLLNVDGQKMAKSLGNFITIPDLLEKNDALDFRFLVVQVHYKSNLDYNEKTIEEARLQREKWNEFIQRLIKLKAVEENSEVKELIEKTRTEFKESMNDDFSLPNAWAVLNEFQRKINSLINDKKLGRKNAQVVVSFLKEINKIFSVFSFEQKEESLPRELKELVEKRWQLRKEKKWVEADKIRAELLEKGIELMDTDSGTEWKKAKKVTLK